MGEKKEYGGGTYFGQICGEISKALEDLGAGVELLSLVGSWGDTLPDDEILEYIQAYNKTGSCIKRVVCEVGDTPGIRRGRFEIIPGGEQ